MRSLIKYQAVRFLITGGLNTLLSYVIYLILNQFMHYNLAYSIAYVAGIIFSYCINTDWVFKQSKSLKSFALYPLVYVVQYLINVILLNVLIKQLHIAESIAPLIIIILTIPITFFLSKKIISIQDS